MFLQLMLILSNNSEEPLEAYMSSSVAKKGHFKIIVNVFQSKKETL